MPGCVNIKKMENKKTAVTIDVSTSIVRFKNYESPSKTESRELSFSVVDPFAP